MPLNRDYRDGYWYFDKYNILLENLPWDKENGGKGDASGRNAFAYVCWPNNPFLKQSFMQCVKQGDDTFIQMYRYPNEGADTMSRDHVGAIILALYINRDWGELDWILNNLPFRLSRKYTQTIDFWLWQKSLKFRGTFKGSILANLFLLLTFLMFIFVVPYNFIARKILRVKKLKYSDFPIPSPKNPKFQKTIYPHFALFLLAWQIRVVKNNWLKWLLQRLLRLDSGNIVIDGVLGKKISREEYEKFTPLTSFVWARRMDTTDDVYIYPMPMEFNDLNRGMLDYLYFGMDNIMLDYSDEVVNAIKKQQPIISY